MMMHPPTRRGVWAGALTRTIPITPTMANTSSETTAATMPRASTHRAILMRLTSRINPRPRTVQPAPANTRNEPAAKKSLPRSLAPWLPWGSSTSWSPRLYLGPARELAIKTRDLTQKVNDDLVAENRKEGQYQARIKTLAAQTYEVDDLKASEGARVRLTQLIPVSGLANDTLSLKPVTGVRVGGAYREIGWAIHARGKLSSVVDFLYLVSTDPRLHRLDYLTINPVVCSWAPRGTWGSRGRRWTCRSATARWCSRPPRAASPRPRA